jgi:imidazolonepropionase-like amidohydrolase
MKHRLWLVLLWFLFSACRLLETPPELADERIAFVHVHLIPIEPAGLHTDQTLLVHKGVIVAMGPAADVPVPAGYRVLDLKGAYVLPGFSDMHVHLAAESDLWQFLRHGITRIRNMGDSGLLGRLAGFPNVLELRERIRRQALPGPEITACGPFLDGDPPQHFMTTPIRHPDQARQRVAETVRAGFDCIKVYNLLSAESFNAIVAAAREHHLPVMGHVPFAVGLEGALNSGMRTIEHLNAYVDNFAGRYRIPPERWAEYARRTAEAGVYNCPTLVMWDAHPPYQNYAQVEADSRYSALPPGLKLLWQISLSELFDVPYADKHHYPQALLALSKPMLKALYEGGAPLLIGTDANLTGVFPGRTALREMELWAEAGIPNAAILESATLTAARLVGQTGQSGTLTVGKRAELVVLRENPLADIRAVYTTMGVFIQERWWPLAVLEAQLTK